MSDLKINTDEATPSKATRNWKSQQLHGLSVLKLLQIQIICVEADLRFYHDNLNKENEHFVFALSLYLVVFYSFPFCQLKAAQCLKGEGGS